MGRRRRKDDTGSLDSLLDTMFNVVGFLVLVMIFTQLSVSTAVQSITQQALDLPDISAEDLADIEDEAETLRQIVEKYRRQAELKRMQMQRDELTKERLAAEIAALKKLVQMDPKLEAETKKLEQMQRQREAELKKTMDKLAEAMRELELTRAMLAKTPEQNVLPASVITLPDPRPQPKGYTEKKIMVRDGKIWSLRQDDLVEAARRLAGQVRKIPEDAENTGGIDGELLQKIFEQRGPKTPDVRVEIEIHGTDKRRPYASIIQREDGGETAEEATKPGSRFRRELVDAKRNQNYIMFVVYNSQDSNFNTYMDVREVADSYDIPAGWTLEHVSRNFNTKAYLGNEYLINRSKKELAEEEEARKKAAEEAAKKPKPEPKPQPEAPKIPPPKQTDDIPNAVID